MAPVTREPYRSGTTASDSSSSSVPAMRLAYSHSSAFGTKSASPVATARPVMPSPTFKVYASAAELTFGSCSPTNAIGSSLSPSLSTTRQLW